MIKAEVNKPGKDKLFRNAVFIICTLISIHFWDLKYIPQPFNAENILVWIISMFAFVMVLRKKDLRFRWPLLLFILGLLVNCFASLINLHQNPKYSILSYSYYYFILVYFLMHYLELEKRFVENTVITFGTIYSLIFIIQYKIFPTEIFNHWVRTATDELQFEIIGHGFLVISFLLVLNRYMTGRKIVYLAFAFLFFMVQFKCGFRTLVAGTALAAFFLVLRLVRLNIRDLALVFVALSMFAAMTQYKSVSRILNQMIVKTKVESKEGKEYIRNVELEFFYSKYPRNLSYYIIGGGKPAGEKSISDYDPYAMGMNYNIVWVDIGLLGFYIVVGGIATLGMMLYALRAIFSNVPREGYYLNLYFFYLIIVSFSNEEIFRDGIFVVQAIALYLIDVYASGKVHEKEKLTQEMSLM